jgi:hypothetical protein
MRPTAMRCMLVTFLLAVAGCGRSHPVSHSHAAPVQSWSVSLPAQEHVAFGGSPKVASETADSWIIQVGDRPDAQVRALPVERMQERDVLEIWHPLFELHGCKTPPPPELEASLETTAVDSHEPVYGVLRRPAQVYVVPKSPLPIVLALARVPMACPDHPVSALPATWRPQALPSGGELGGGMNDHIHVVRSAEEARAITGAPPELATVDYATSMVVLTSDFIDGWRPVTPPAEVVRTEHVVIVDAPLQNIACQAAVPCRFKTGSGLCQATYTSNQRERADAPAASDGLYAIPKRTGARLVLRRPLVSSSTADCARDLVPRITTTLADAEARGLKDPGAIDFRREQLVWFSVPRDLDASSGSDESLRDRRISQAPAGSTSATLVVEVNAVRYVDDGCCHFREEGIHGCDPVHRPDADNAELIVDWTSLRTIYRAPRTAAPPHLDLVVTPRTECPPAGNHVGVSR